MSVKGAADPANHLQFILSSLTYAAETKVDWTAAAAANDIGYARNASQKFKDTLKKYGFKFENHHISLLDATAPATPTAGKDGKGRKSSAKSADRGKKPGPGKANGTTAAKKRKIAVSEDEEESAEGEISHGAGVEEDEDVREPDRKDHSEPDAESNDGSDSGEL